MRQEFEVPGRLAGCNDYVRMCRANARAGAKVKRENQDIALWCIRQAGLAPMRGPVDVRFTWIEPDMRRDKDNIRFAAKFVLDALVEAGVLENDNWACVGSLSDDYLVNKANPRVVVELEEA